MNSIILATIKQRKTSKLLKTFTNVITKSFGVLKNLIRFKLLDETITISGICLMVIGTITGVITLNPIILGVINGSGIIVTNIGKMKNYKKKIEMVKIAFTT